MSTPSIPARALLGVIWLYRMSVSALIGRRCRYLPTCSEYAAEAIARHGAWRGLWLGLARVSRCHPLGGDGFDPPPDKADGPFWRLGRWWR